MPNPRYFLHSGPMALGGLAEITGARLANAADAAITVTGVAPLAQAGEGQITFFADRRYRADFERTMATACFIPDTLVSAVPENVAALITSYPHAAFSKAANAFYREIPFATDGQACDPSAQLAEDVVVSPGCVIGPNVEIGMGTWLGPNVVIGPGVKIGSRCHIGPGASIRCAVLGHDVKVSANASIGEAGFGATGDEGGPIDIPQLGGVVIGNDVTVGANTTIDRGAFDDTVIEDRVKVDNLVQIAHNVRIGAGSVLAAHTGISGSANIGRGVQLAGRAGVADHVNIGDGARIGAASGVMGDVPAGETWAGYPAKPIRQWLRETVILGRMSKSKSKSQPEEA